ncbi:MAG: hypothetical protein QJR00_00290 [Bacillota bacterium]|nr:hypothetical protein [Bacillota bacterium]
MATFHLYLGWSLIGIFSIAFFWSLGVWIARRSRIGIPFWWFLRLGAFLFVLQMAAGILMWTSGLRPANLLHIMYAALVFLGFFAAETLKPGGSWRRLYLRAGRPFYEPMVAFLLSLYLLGVAIRAFTTGLGYP